MKLSRVVMVVVSLLAFTQASNNQQVTSRARGASPAMVADGNPAPPFPPAPNASVDSGASWLIADGNPAPPFPPKPQTSVSSQAAWLFADGNPAPPFPPSTDLPFAA